HLERDRVAPYGGHARGAGRRQRSIRLPGGLGHDLVAGVCTQRWQPFGERLVTASSQNMLVAGWSDTSPERRRRDHPVAGAPGLCQNNTRPVYFLQMELSTWR